MKRYGIRNKDLSQVLSLTDRTISNKLAGETDFTVKEALDSYTSEAAKGSFEEHIKGKIQSGMLADFLILGDNLFTADVNTIKDIPVLATYMGGKKVYSK